MGSRGRLFSRILPTQTLTFLLRSIWY